MKGSKVMKRCSKTVLGFLVSILLLVLLNGCEKKSDNGVEPEPIKYHTFTIDNNTIYAHKQLTKLNVTSVEDGSTVTADFVINYGDNRQVQIPIPKTGTYKVEIFSSNGQSMWWSSIALELPGNSIIQINADGYPVHFWGLCAGIQNSGTNMTP